TADLREPEVGSKTPKGKGDDRIQCVVVTPERVIIDELVDFIALPLYDGELGVLHGRAPLIGRLGYGELRTRVNETIRRYFVDGGFAQVRDDVVTVLTNRAIPAGRVDPSAAHEELEKARTRVARTDYERTEKEKAISRARAQLRVSAHKA